MLRITALAALLLGIASAPIAVAHQQTITAVSPVNGTLYNVSIGTVVVAAGSCRSFPIDVATMFRSKSPFANDIYSMAEHHADVTVALIPSGRDYSGRLQYVVKSLRLRLSGPHDAKAACTTVHPGGTITGLFMGFTTAPAGALFDVLYIRTLDFRMRILAFPRSDPPTFNGQRLSFCVESGCARWPSDLGIRNAVTVSINTVHGPFAGPSGDTLQEPISLQLTEDQPFGNRQPGPMYFMECGRNPTMAPTSITLACADGNAVLKRLSWSGWGTQNVGGAGIFSENRCVPDCASSRTWVSYPVRVALIDPESCPNGGSAYALLGIGPKSSSAAAWKKVTVARLWTFHCVMGSP